MSDKIKKIELKNGDVRWTFQVYTGVNPKTGKQGTTERRFNTYKEARIALRRIQTQVDDGTYYDTKINVPKPITFKELYEKWWEEEYIYDAGRSTQLVTKRLFQNRILPAIGNYKVDKVTKRDVQKCADEWGKHQSCKKWINFIKRVYRYAHRKDFTSHDPTKDVKIPEPQKKNKNEKLFYETEELERFIKALEAYDNLQAETFLRLLFFTGIRRGEGLALKWKYVDFENNEIQIEHSTERVEDEETGQSYMRIGPPKNLASYRTINVDDKTMDLLKEMYQYKINERVFNSENGGLLSDGKPRKWLRSVAKKAGLEPIKVHASRHTHASLLFELGATTKDVQERLGHEKSETTMNIYTHVTKKSTEKLGKKFAEYVDF